MSPPGWRTWSRNAWPATPATATPTPRRSPRTSGGTWPTSRWRACPTGARPPEARRALEASCRAVWEARGRIARRADSLGPASRRKVRDDLVDVVALLADLRARPGRGAEARREALRLLDDLEATSGPDL